MADLRWKFGLLLTLALLGGGVLTVSGLVDVVDLTGEFEAAFQGKCGPSSPCTQLCVELHDGTFECQCRSGYRLLLDGYSCVELNNTAYSDDSDEYDSDLELKPSKMSTKDEERDRYRAAKAAAVAVVQAAAAAAAAKGGRPLPRPVPSSLFLEEPGAAAAASVALAAEARERSNYLKKFNPVDDETLDFIGMKGKVTPKPTERSKVTGKVVTNKAGGDLRLDANEEEYDSFEDDRDDDEDDDEDSTNEAEEDLGSLERSSPKTSAVKEQGGGGEEEDYIEDDFILPPRALPLKDAAPPTNLPNPPAPPSSADSSGFISMQPLVISPSKDEDPIAPVAPSLSGGEGSTISDNELLDNAPPAPILVDCPLKCNRGICSREPWDDVSEDRLNMGYRCLCPMGTRGSFCEVEEVAEEGGGYNSGLFRGRSWVAFPVLHDAYMSDQISLEFRPQSPDGILLLTGERDDLSGDYLALFLRDGFLEFRFDCGSGSGMVRSSSPVNLQQWNKASIVRRRWDGWMQLNDGPFTQGRSKGLFSRITFRQPVYIGGQGNITFNSVSSIPSNFDEEPEVVLSSSSTTSINNYTGTFMPPLLSTLAPAASASPDLSSTSSTYPSSSTSSQPVEVDGFNFLSTSMSSGSVVTTKDGEEEGLEASTTVAILKKNGGFQGCIRNLVINDRVYRFGLEPAGDSLQGFDIESCNDQGVCDLVKCQHGGQCLVQKDENPTCLCPLGYSGPLCETPLDLQIPSFNGSSYLKYGGLGLIRVLSWLELEIVVKPDAMDGLILYNGYKTDGMGDFISLVIDQGYIEFAMDLGTGTAIIRSESPVALDEWHHVHVSRTSRLISLRIDNQPPLMALTPGAFTQLSLPHNLFLGGIPDSQWLSPKVKVHGGFSGCIQKLVINEKPLRIMGSAMSGVNLENCAHPCLRNPCDHGGDCIPQLDTFKCHCPLGFRDSYCQTRMDKEDRITAPRFIGDSYLRFTNPRILKRLSGWRLNLSFRVKTDLSRGLLIWAGRKWMTSASDFISMGLRNGFVTASFSLGSGQITIAYNFTSVNDGHWHQVHLIRNEQEASLSVDDGPPVTGVAPGKLRQLNINDGLYIGGLEDARHQSMNRYTEGFVGCLTDLVLGSERVSLLQEASEGRNVDYCD